MVVVSVLNLDKKKESTLQMVKLEKEATNYSYDTSNGIHERDQRTKLDELFKVFCTKTSFHSYIWTKVKPNRKKKHETFKVLLE